MKLHSLLQERPDHLRRRPSHQFLQAHQTHRESSADRQSVRILLDHLPAKGSKNSIHPSGCNSQSDTYRSRRKPTSRPIFQSHNRLRRNYHHRPRDSRSKRPTFSRKAVSVSADASPINLPQHNIDTPNHRHHIREQPSLAHRLQRLQRCKSRVPHMHPVRLRSPVAETT